MSERESKLAKVNTRSSWAGSNGSTLNYRTSNFTAAFHGPKAGKLASSLVQNKPEVLHPNSHISIKQSSDAFILLQSIPNASIYSCLWSLSLAGSTSKLTTNTLEPLSNLAALGFLDLSRTDVSLKTLQSVLRQIHIFKLHLFQCSKLAAIMKHITTTHELSFTDNQESKSGETLRIVGVAGDFVGCGGDAPGAVGTADEMFRGFLIYALPNMWSLCGVPVLFHERRRWSTYFGVGGKGQFCDLIRKHFVDFEVAFIPRVKKEFPQKTASGVKIKAEYIYQSPIAKKLWSETAKLQLSQYPINGFPMPLEQDQYRLTRLASDLESRVCAQFPTTVFGFSAIRGSVAAICGVPNDSSPKDAVSGFPITYTLESRISLALLIFGSLIQDVPIVLLQSCLEEVFEANESSGRRKVSWAQRPVSPLLWRIQERLEYLGILIALIEAERDHIRTEESIMDSMGANSEKYRVLFSRFKNARSIVRWFYEIVYTGTVVDVYGESWPDFNVLGAMRESPVSKLHPSTTHLLANSSMKQYVHSAVSRHFSGHERTTQTNSIVHQTYMLQVELLPFVVCKLGSNILPKDFLLVFPRLQSIIVAAADGILKISHSAEVSLDGRIRPARPRSRAFSASTVRETSTVERLVVLARDGIISAMEIENWLLKAGGEKEAEEMQQVDNLKESTTSSASIEALVFHIKLKLLDAVNFIEMCVFGADRKYPVFSRPATPALLVDAKSDTGKVSPHPSEILFADFESSDDDDMRVFETLRSLRISRHPRDPVPVMKLSGKKVFALK